MQTLLPQYRPRQLHQRTRQPQQPLAKAAPALVPELARIALARMALALPALAQARSAEAA